MAYFDRFDIAEAHYLYYSHFHSGQWSDEYRRLCKMSEYFRPRPNLSIETLTENGQEIYDFLVARKMR